MGGRRPRPRWRRCGCRSGGVRWRFRKNSRVRAVPVQGVPQGQVVCTRKVGGGAAGAGIAGAMRVTARAVQRPWAGLRRAGQGNAGCATGTDGPRPARGGRPRAPSPRPARGRGGRRGRGVPPLGSRAPPLFAAVPPGAGSARAPTGGRAPDAGAAVPAFRRPGGACSGRGAVGAAARGGRAAPAPAPPPETRAPEPPKPIFIRRR